jgi:hypothetical protein
MAPTPNSTPAQPIYQGPNISAIARAAAEDVRRLVPGDSAQLLDDSRRTPGHPMPVGDGDHIVHIDKARKNEQKTRANSGPEKLGTFSGVFVPTMNIFNIIMFLRFGFILGQSGVLGMLGNLFFLTLSHSLLNNFSRNAHRRISY